MMQVEQISAMAAKGGNEMDSIRQMIAETSRHARVKTSEQVAASKAMQSEMARQELDMMNFQTKRAVANEMANRTLSKMFGSFSLVQKIMQNMG